MGLNQGRCVAPPAWAAPDWESAVELPFYPESLLRDLDSEPTTQPVSLRRCHQLYGCAYPRWWNNAGTFLVAKSY